MKVGLVLGAGGTVGLGYHAGVLHALDEVGGFRAEAADLIVGTSAGSVMAAYLRSGWTAQDFWELALGVHPEMAPLGRGVLADPLTPIDESEEPLPAILTPAFRGPLDLLRRAVGTAYVLTRSAVRVPSPVMPGVLRAAFPAGMFLMTEGRRRFTDELPAAWPSEPLWLCAVDIISGRRIVLGSRGTPRITLQEAVMASCAIPGVYPPVKLGQRVLVDGGTHSTTNLDLAVRAGCDVIVAIAPMSYDARHAPGCVHRITRRFATEAFNREVALARRRGVRVLQLRPSAAEIDLHGYRMMRSDGLDAVAMAAYDNASVAIRTDRFRRTLEELAA